MSEEKAVKSKRTRKKKQPEVEAVEIDIPDAVERGADEGAELPLATLELPDEKEVEADQELSDLAKLAEREAGVEKKVREQVPSQTPTKLRLIKSGKPLKAQKYIGRSRY